MPWPQWSLRSPSMARASGLSQGVMGGLPWWLSPYETFHCLQQPAATNFYMFDFERSQWTLPSPLSGHLSVRDISFFRFPVLMMSLSVHVACLRLSPLNVDSSSS
eukprot:s186_g16.t1